MPESPKETILIFGFALGYHVESYLNKRETPVHLLILEPISSLKPIAEKFFDRLLRSYSEKGHQIRMIFGLDSFLEHPLTHWLSEGTNKVTPFLHPVYTRKFPDLTVHFLDSLKQNSQTSQNQTAKDYFQKIWIRNEVRNVSSIFKNLNSSGIISGAKDNFFQDQTLLFTGASPSLEGETDWILKYRNRFHLLASDTSLGWLVASGIVPDMVLSIDSSRGTLFHFRNILPPDVPIVTWFGGSAHLFDLPNPKWIYFSTHPLDQTLRALFFPEAPILENPSLNMAGIAVSFAKQLAYGRMFLKGVDFQRSGGRTHCRSTGYESYDRLHLSRKKTLFGIRYQKSDAWDRRFSVLEILKREAPELFQTELVSDLPEAEKKEVRSGLILEDPRKIQIPNWIRFCIAHPEFQGKNYFSSRIQRFVFR
ncbi:motility associated factor glycosyltransferase family protein [Leptospira sp. 201903070]|uniref:Motility associated factor glycosyltransferase family protein n=1 Tax=Leptospira ainlahdjerensis TaxID=2810033 RepID=A0ABS2U6Z8_9LEPT|nr:6-hydroxymethylpterin diphosphokinase MptE-like protein [Leptospira ainlahdjerensis]MBM9575919.1 motility associated factor glycosyltransferase family protein [Leptospira ainlahdjerensis]